MIHSYYRNLYTSKKLNKEQSLLKSVKVFLIFSMFLSRLFLHGDIALSHLSVIQLLSILVAVLALIGELALNQKHLRCDILVSLILILLIVI